MRKESTYSQYKQSGLPDSIHALHALITEREGVEYSLRDIDEVVGLIAQSEVDGGELKSLAGELEIYSSGRIVESDVIERVAKQRAGIFDTAPVIPLPEGRPPVMAYRHDFLPEQLSSYVRDISERMQCPPDFVAISAVVGLAGCIGCKFAIKPKQNDSWTVTPTLWGALIGRPSSMKTPSMGEALKIIDNIELVSRKEYEEECQLFEADKKLSELEADAAKNDAKKILKSKGKEAAREVLINSQKSIPDESEQPH